MNKEDSKKTLTLERSLTACGRPLIVFRTDLLSAPVYLIRMNRVVCLKIKQCEKKISHSL